MTSPPDHVGRSGARDRTAERLGFLDPAGDGVIDIPGRLLRVSPSDMQPGRSGTVTRNPPPSRLDHDALIDIDLTAVGIAGGDDATLASALDEHDAMQTRAQRRHRDHPRLAIVLATILENRSALPPVVTLIVTFGDAAREYEGLNRSVDVPQPANTLKLSTSP